MQIYADNSRSFGVINSDEDEAPQLSASQSSDTHLTTSQSLVTPSSASQSKLHSNRAFSQSNAEIELNVISKKYEELSLTLNSFKIENLKLKQENEQLVSLNEASKSMLCKFN